jgi:6-phosphogluconolactonase
MTEIPFYLGSYSMPSPWTGTPHGHGAGIVRAALDVDTGGIQFGEAITAELNPSFLVRNRDARLLWAISEPEVAGDLVCFEEGAAGELLPRGRVVTGADAPCHLAIDWDRRLGFVSHYHGGALALLSLRENGEPQASLSLTASPRIVRGELREGKSHVHASMRLGNAELMVTDTGRDLILHYQIQGERSAASLELLDALPLPAGTGPRHLARHAATGAVYVSNQNCGGVTVIGRGAGSDGQRFEVRWIVPDAGLRRDVCIPSEIAVHPLLDVVYLANRRDNSITVFSIESMAGELTPRRSFDVRARNPRHFCVSPDGGWLIVANQDSDELTVFRIEDRGRELVYTGRSFAVATPTAICF